MKLPFDFGDLDVAEWIRGAIAAFVSGGASAVTSGITVSALDNKDYNLTTGASKLMLQPRARQAGTVGEAKRVAITKARAKKLHAVGCKAARAIKTAMCDPGGSSGLS